MAEIWAFYINPRNNFGGETVSFLLLILIPIFIAIVVGVVIGALVSRSTLQSFIAINISDLIRATPVLAVLFIFVPIFKIGYLPAAIALTLLGIPPILLNTYTGLRGIDKATIEAARGMGMTGWQIMTRVQAPLVLPVVAAGIRTAAVQIVATAPLGGLIGAGGYGDYIIDGVNTLNNTEILAGAIVVSALALIIEIGMGRLERRLTPAGLRVQAQAAAVAAKG
jgi:osmoprotectant transport system permease protein